MATTPVLALPYPVGTDRVMDGDNAIQALAERIEARLPRGCVAFTGYTANQGPIGGANTIGSLTVPSTVGAGRRIRLSCVYMFTHTVANGFVYLRWFDGAASIQEACFPSPPTVGVAFMGQCILVLQSVAGAKTYTVQSSVSAGTATAHADAARPSFVMAEDLGPWSMS